MRKKALALMMALTLVAALLSACTGGASSSAPAPASTAPAASQVQSTAEAAPEPEAREPIEIEYWHTASEAMGGMTLEEMIAQFNEQSDWITVTPVFNSGGYEALMQNMQAEAAAGKSPAIIQCAYSFLEYFPNNFGYTSPQTVVDSFYPDDAGYFDENFTETMLNLATNSKGELIGLPYSVSSPVLFYNKELFAAAGLPDKGPETWEEVAEYAKQIKDETGKYGLYIMEGDAFIFQAIVESNGGHFITWNGDAAESTINGPESVEAMQLYADMVLKDQSAVSLAVSADGVKAFNDGEVGMMVSSVAWRGNVQSNAPFEVDAVNFPVFEGKQRQVPSGGSILVITGQTEAEQQAAWELMKFLYTPEMVTTWTVGTGYVPPTKGAEAFPEMVSFLDENSMMKAATSQMEDVVPWAAHPGNAGLEAQQILVDTRSQILSGKSTVEDALNGAAEKINALL